MFLDKFQDARIKLVHQGFHCFPCCHEVEKINERSFVFKSLEKKNFGACRSTDRCLLECSSDYWLNHVGETIAQAPAHRCKNVVYDFYYFYKKRVFNVFYFLVEKFF